MRHFIAFVTLGIAAIGSGMVLASHFSMPESEASVTRASTPSNAPAPSFQDVDIPSLPAMPRTLPDPEEALDGAGQAFGKATDTMAHYSDRAFGATAMKIKRSVDQAEMPTLH